MDYEKLTDRELEEKLSFARFEVADIIREQIRRKGYSIKDTPDGPVITNA